MKKYFPRIFGNEATSYRVGSAISSGRMPHAFLILGPSGSGKHMLALEIAAALNCTGEGGSLPCGRCQSCKRIYENNFTDVKLLSKPRDKATLGVSAIKDFREDMFLSATESDFKVYIIADGECMTVEAQNALLKVLEEPPSGVVIIILATEGDKILTTIKSRAQTVAMERFPKDALAARVLDISAEARELKRSSPDKFEAAIMSADGRIGEALRLLDRGLSEALDEERADIMRIAGALRRGAKAQELIGAMASLPQKRTELLTYLELLTAAIRDLCTVHRASDVPMLFFTSRESCSELAEAIGQKRIFDAAEAVFEAHEHCSKNANTTNVIAALTARLRPI